MPCGLRLTISRCDAFVYGVLVLAWFSSFADRLLRGSVAERE
jgi:hypothetical protein